jgi:beta-lactamase regulating signal transducer with metallopeptidase domain
MDKLGWFISSAVLAAVVIALRALFGKRMSPLVRSLVWLPLLARMLVPGALFSAPVSVARVTEPVTASLSEPVAAAPRADVVFETPELTTQTPQTAQTPAQTPQTPAQTAAPARRTVTAGEVLVYVWSAGVIAVAVWFVVANLRLFIRLRRRRRPLEKGVYAVEGLDSSCLFLGAIYVPEGTEGAALRHVLAHERAHKRHLDGLWAILRCAALALHWFDPLAWLAAVLSRRDQELFADAGALSSLGEAERVGYGETLIALSAGYKRGVSPLCAATRMTGGRRALRERVENIAAKRRQVLAVALAAVVIAVAAAGCVFAGAKKPAPEKLYVLSHQREAVWLVGADGAEKVCDLPDTAATADVCGSILWYADGTSLVRVALENGEKTEYALPENEGVGYYMFAEENAAYVALADGHYDNLYTGEIYRVGADGAEQVTHGYAYYMTTCPFAVDGGSVYCLAGGVPAGSELRLVREDADGTRVEFDRPGFPLTCISVDGGRVYACWAYDCRSYDAATGGGERIETAFASVPSARRVKTAGATENGSLPHSAAARGGWLYYAAGNYEFEGADDSTLLMARRISDGKLVEYAAAEDVGFYGFDSVVTFGERGFVLNYGYWEDKFVYIPYYDGK